MGETVSGTSKAPPTTFFARSFGLIAALVAIGLLATGKWPSATGVTIGSIPVLWMTRRLNKVLRGIGSTKSRTSGAATMSAINAVVGVVIVCAGALLGDVFILIVSAMFGTWMIGVAALLAVVA
jgi:hypothetical protein